MYIAFATFYSLIAAITFSAVGTGDLIPSRTMSLWLSFSGEKNHAVVYISKSMQVAELEAVLEAVKKTGIKNITLKGEPKWVSSEPTHVIRAEICLASDLQPSGIATLLGQIRQLPNVSEVKFLVRNRSGVGQK